MLSLVLELALSLANASEKQYFVRILGSTIRMHYVILPYSSLACIPFGRETTCVIPNLHALAARCQSLGVATVPMSSFERGKIHGTFLFFLLNMPGRRCLFYLACTALLEGHFVNQTM